MDFIEELREAEGGDAEAQYQVGYYLLHEEAADEEMLTRGLQYLRMAAEQDYGDGLAALDMGDAYCKGTATPVDFKAGL
ncbi:MAG: hypothetical protein LBB57_06290, partial [Clostridiales Family XIII bacterium]|nr:hypothetical protein [Clostridiales Family XIII bacterium]